MLVVVAVAMAVNQMNYCLILGKRFMSQWPGELCWQEHELLVGMHYVS
jgi:hypothetical protein